MKVNIKIFIIFAMSFCVLRTLGYSHCSGTHTY